MKVFVLMSFVISVAWAQTLETATQVVTEGIEEIERGNEAELQGDDCPQPKLEICAQFEIFKELGVPENALRQAFFFYHQNQDQFFESRYISIADYTQNSTQERFYLLDLETGTVRTEKVSHGSGHRGNIRYGDPNHDGMIDRCHHGNDLDDRINMTRAGFFKTANLYRSTSHEDIRNGVREWPYLDDQNNNGMRMHGLSPDVNDEAMTSGVVMHGAWYNDLAAQMGRSYGCPAFESDVAVDLLPLISGGNLYYSYTPRCEGLHQRVLDQIQGWQEFCSNN